MFLSHTHANCDERIKCFGKRYAEMCVSVDFTVTRCFQRSYVYWKKKIYLTAHFYLLPLLLLLLWTSIGAPIIIKLTFVSRTTWRLFTAVNKRNKCALFLLVTNDWCRNSSSNVFLPKMHVRIRVEKSNRSTIHSKICNCIIMSRKLYQSALVSEFQCDGA